MSDERSVHGRVRPDMVVKSDWVFKAYNQFRVDAANVSSHDLRYVSHVLAKEEFARRRQAEPFLDRLVSANIVSEGAGFVAPRPFILREFPSRQSGGTSIRVALIGLTETAPAAPDGFKFVDPAEAARRVMPEAKKQANIVVVLAKFSSEQEVARIAREAPGIDVIIDGNSESLEDSFTPPRYVGQTLIVFTPFETRMLGELRFYRSAQGKVTTRQRFITLDETSIPEDPDAKQLVDAATRAEAEARTNSKRLLDSWMARSRAPETANSPDGNSSRGDATAGYVSSAACSRCHMGQYVKWANSAHAHATDPMPPRVLEFEAGCLDCHATGSKSTTNKLDLAKLQNVQCEQCHGPGSDHVAKPAKGYGRVAMQTACVGCHTPDASPDFDFRAAWEKIRH